ncbi:cell envelope integrity protein TolA [Pseudomonadota bacterium]|nr:cell envelope integrity protein TolA [Pseudomonadota bacterium]|tara:strand:+ start:297 stop:1121 length:825 start_codon:yes stop_codon:yes gene_type:complete
MVSYYYIAISIIFHVITFLIFSFSLPDNEQHNLKKTVIGESLNATAINESEVHKEIERIKAIRSKSKIQEEARLRDLQTKVNFQEKKLKALELEKKKAEKLQKKLTIQSDATKREMAKFTDKKKKEQKELKLAEKNRAAIESRNKELQEQNKKLQKKLAESQLRQQIEIEEKTLGDDSNDSNDMDIVDLYAKKIENQIKANFKILPGQEGLSCTIKITLVRDGSVVGVEILKTSGNSAFDRAAENSVFTVSPFPVPESDRVFDKMREITFVFSP